MFALARLKGWPLLRNIDREEIREPRRNSVGWSGWQAQLVVTRVMRSGLDVTVAASTSHGVQEEPRSVNG